MSVKIGPYTFDRVDYDAGADVLYLVVGDPDRAVDWDETPEGHAVSFDTDGNLVNLTLVGIRRLHDEARESGEPLTISLPMHPSPQSLAVALA
ncbi:MAG TPA: hypothetical protein VGF95_12290 [Solirubrobacteraceae bacterium]|jgi:uncharacterized protein YuzE